MHHLLGVYRREVAADHRNGQCQQKLQKQGKSDSPESSPSSAGNPNTSNAQKGRRKHTSPMNIIMLVKLLPSHVFGYISPYPVVVIAAMVQYIEIGMDWNSDLLRQKFAAQHYCFSGSLFVLLSGKVHNWVTGIRCSICTSRSYIKIAHLQSPQLVR